MRRTHAWCDCPRVAARYTSRGDARHAKTMSCSSGLMGVEWPAGAATPLDGAIRDWPASSSRSATPAQTPPIRVDDRVLHETQPVAPMRGIGGAGRPQLLSGGQDPGGLAARNWKFRGGGTLTDPAPPRSEPGRSRRSRSLLPDGACGSQLAAIDAVLLEKAVQCGSAHAELGGGAADVAPRPGEGIDDDLPLDTIARLSQRDVLG